MHQGKVKWFNNAKGYGFIVEDGGTEDLFAHFSSIQMDGYKTLKAGQAVTFEKQPSGKGTHAINICAKEGVQPKALDDEIISVEEEQLVRPEIQTDTTTTAVDTKETSVTSI